MQSFSVFEVLTLLAVYGKLEVEFAAIAEKIIVDTDLQNII
ncbi:hypothetical protein [Acetivibrio clariflavus]|nr:hypothetical protein [Acetivibrio clariflavus]HOP99667.1 hypothetical protein [Acetivibrio clariflavus]